MTIRNRGIRGVYMETNTSVYGVLGAESNSLTVRGGYLSQILSFPYTTVNAQVLIVAGGGGGGYDASGGGGAGGLYYSNNLSISNTNYTVTIGAGGTGGISGAGIGKSGSNTSFGSYTVIGGGGGASATATGANGGSGGGGGGWDGGVSVGGSSIQNTTFGYGVGNAGGTGGSNANWPAGGGGGAGARGANSSGASAGAGGNGLAYNFANGTSVYYAGGGGGGGSSSTIGGTGGLGGGGAGIGSSSALSGYTGSAGTGGGGGGSGHLANGGAGGSGIAIISYPIPQQFSGGVVTNLNGTNVVHTFTTSGSLNALATPIDTYFPQTTLLLHGDGTNGANNTVFVDSSTNALTITTNGKPLQGTFSPFSQTGWSTYFSSSAMSVPYSTSLHDWWTTDYTLECWVYPTTFTGWENGSGIPSLIGNMLYNQNTNYWSFGLNASGQVTFYSYPTLSIIASTATATLNQWNHIALTKTSTTITLWLNGVAVKTSAYSAAGTPQSATGAGLVIGAYNNNYINGYVSNLRILKGTALYSSTFVPPTTALTAIANTTFLTFQDNRIKDNYSSPATFTTLTGTPSVQPFSPFSPSSAYSNTVVGGSAYFNGSTDYLRTSSSNNLNCGTGDFTMECWVFIPATPSGSYPAIVSSADWDVGNTGVSLRYGNTGYAGKFTFHKYPSDVILASSSTFPINAWHHVAVTRSGSTITLWVNGTSQATTTNSGTVDWNNNAGGMKIGGGDWSGTPFYIQMYLSDLRLIKGTALYNNTFTPPTAPLTAISNTQFLLNATNAGIIDQTAKNSLTTYGSAAINSIQSKFGGTSMYFDGSTGYVRIPSNVINTIGTSDFTIEFWAYTTVGSQTNILYEQRSVGTQVTPTIYLNAGALTYYVNGVGVITGATFPTSQWNHVAVCRSSGSTKMFLNGTQTGSTYSDTNSYVTEQIILGAYFNGGPSAYFNGYIDELRVSRIARYTSNFTPPTSAFVDR